MGKALFVSLVGLIEVGSSICSFTTPSACYVDFPRHSESLHENDIICAYTYSPIPVLFKECVISCNEPLGCSNKVVQLYGDQCTVNCNTERSCNSITVITHNCKQVYVNLKDDVSNVYIESDSNHSAVLRVNDDIINNNDCNVFLVDSNNNEITIGCDEPPSKRSLMPYSKRSVDASNSTENIIELNDHELEMVKVSADKDELTHLLVLVLLVISIICSVYFSIIFICRYFKRDPEQRDICSGLCDRNALNQISNRNEDNTDDGYESSYTLTFDDVDEMAQIEPYLTMMNEMLSVKSISVIST